MRILEIDNIEYPIPDKWNELGKNDFLEFCRISMLQVGSKYQRFMLLHYFTGLSYVSLLHIPKNALPEVMALFDFLFEASKLTINHLPELEGLKGPEPGLTNFTFEQFLGQAEPYYFSVGSGNYSDIDQLVNILYNYNGPEENFEKLKQLDPAIKFAVFLFYQGCSNFIRFKFRSVFEKPTGNNRPDGLEFVRLVNSLNQNDVSKNQAIKQANLYEALSFLTSLINKNGQGI